MRYCIFNPQHSWGMSSVASCLFKFVTFYKWLGFFEKSNLPFLTSVIVLSVSVLIMISVPRNSKLRISMMLKLLVH